MFNAGRTLDELGWRGLWSYITAAPPGTALHYIQSEGWTLGDKIAAEHLTATRQLFHRYTARNFQGGADIPFPERIEYPGAVKTDEEAAALSWETATIDDLVSPEVRELLTGA